MLIIFTLSSRQRLELNEDFTINFIMFKLLHMLEYAILYTLLFRAFLFGKKANKKDALKKAFIFAVLYALSDEIHQTLVPTREGTLRDVIIDTAGITLMYFFIKKNFDRLYNYFK